MGEHIAHVFAAVLAICDAQGLIGREMFAIDGVKLPSSASKQRSGTRTDFARQATKLEAAATTMLARHRANDALPVEPALAAKAVQRVERLERDAAQLRDWLATHPDDRRGAKGAIRKSNRTDNESAEMATGQGRDPRVLRGRGRGQPTSDHRRRSRARRPFSRATSPMMPRRARASLPRASRCTGKGSRW